MAPTENLKSLWKEPLAALAQTLPVVDDDLLQDGGRIALIGPTGVGKTTTIAKIAARFAMDNWSDDIALISADSYRIGAKEHLTAFANIIGAKVYSASSFEELSETLTRLEHKKLVLIDTEGRSQRDRDLVQSSCGLWTQRRPGSFLPDTVGCDAGGCSRRDRTTSSARYRWRVAS